ncbi:MAG: 23S rRNA (adenine(2503)-C(2))-methyltransferase RlmN [Candidatus Omnitrophota bacterium]|nr:23S rRNA (adenine(2503)-C(2))-methyltransferase RlmN [Candidatus Omnitrophota bacterium]
MKTEIRDLSLEELKKEMVYMGEPAHRAGQIFLWLNRKNAYSFKSMTNLPKSLVPKLEKRYVIGKLHCEEHLVSKDGTEKLLWRLKDGERIETVLIRQKKRRTLCLSTQAGCRFKCPFCASGLKGFVRDLSVSEILNQVFLAQEICKCRVTNIVFMGMGEPLDNYNNLVRSIRLINHPSGLAIGARKITVSTCGIVPGILKLKEIGLQIELSVSLHAANNTLRNELVPVNRRYPLEALISACKEYYETTGRVITLEYTLISGRNDSLKEAERLAKIAKELKAKINLITCNPFAERAYGAPDRKSITLFREKLRGRGATVTVRRPRGRDILAACGQLAAGFAREKENGQ